MEVTFEDADFRYTELQEWRDEINMPILNTEGVTFTSLSQANNAIRIGVEDERFESKVFEQISNYKVPDEAVKISVTGPVQDDISSHTLRDMYRPLVGG